MEQEILDLKAAVKEENDRRIKEGNDKDLERVKETEQLRKEMLFNIKKTKANLLAMNDKQLQTTTHLTMLQNH